MEQQLTILGSYRPGEEVKRRHQIELEKLYSKNQTLSRIREEILNSPFDFVAYFNKINVDENFGLDLLVQMALHRRTTASILVGILRHHFEPSENASQLTADTLYKCVEADLVDWHNGTKQFITKFTVSEDVQRDLDRFQYPLPMVIKPPLVRDNRDTGYLTTRGSLLLRKNHHDDDICIDHINRVNRIKFSIDADTAMMIKNSWRNLDKPKVGETKEEYNKRVKAFEKYDRTARDVMMLVTLFGNEFYLTHKYDKRGRIYCQGYHINYQGAPWNKAVIELADKEYVE